MMAGALHVILYAYIEYGKYLWIQGHLDRRSARQCHRITHVSNSVSNVCTPVRTNSAIYS